MEPEDTAEYFHIVILPATPNILGLKSVIVDKFSVCQLTEMVMNSRLRFFKNVITSKAFGRVSTPFQSMKCSYQSWSLFNPSSEHQALRDMVRSFVDAEVEPQAMEFNKQEKFNIDLFRKLGDLGLLGITVEAQYGGSEMDAVAAVIVHGKRSLTPTKVFSASILRSFEKFHLKIRNKIAFRIRCLQRQLTT